MWLHAMDNGADEVDVEDGVDVNQMEDHGEGEKPATTESCHCYEVGRSR